MRVVMQAYPLNFFTMAQYAFGRLRTLDIAQMCGFTSHVTTVSAARPHGPPDCSPTGSDRARGRTSCPRRCMRFSRRAPRSNTSASATEGCTAGRRRTPSRLSRYLQQTAYAVRSPRPATRPTSLFGKFIDGALLRAAGLQRAAADAAHSLDHADQSHRRRLRHVPPPAPCVVGPTPNSQPPLALTNNF